MTLIDKNFNGNISEALQNSIVTPTLLLIDKEKEWTSFDVIARLRKMINIKKIGHAGTLDPLATGLLLLGVGKGTKLLTELTGMDKTYIGTIKFGATTDSDDSEKEEENIKNTSELEFEKLDLLKNNFIGEIQQKPPRFSAKKIKGKKMYQMARKGIDFEVKSVTVSINEFELLNFNSPFCDFKIACSKGTYIRSIARDLGELSGYGGYLSELRRTLIDKYSVENAFKLSELNEILEL